MFSPFYNIAASIDVVNTVDDILNWRKQEFI